MNENNNEYYQRMTIVSESNCQAHDSAWIKQKKIQSETNNYN